MAKRRIAAVVKIQIPAGAATPAPPVGTALGPSRREHHGILQAVQRGPPSPSAARSFRPRSPMFEAGRSPSSPRPAAHPGAAEGRRRPRQGPRRHPVREGAGAVTDAQVDRHRPHEDARPQRQRPRRGEEAGRGHRPLDGHHGQRKVGGNDGRKTTGTASKHYQDALRRFDQSQAPSHAGSRPSTW